MRSSRDTLFEHLQTTPDSLPDCGTRPISMWVCPGLDPAGHNSKRRFFRLPLSFQRYRDLSRPRPAAGCCRTSKSELLESRKTQPSPSGARWDTAIIPSFESLPS